jgi:cytochrome oxidase Cu insertion factor (SCO1/SenC/PrrC family)
VAAGAVYATVIRPSSSTNASRSNVRQGQQTAIGQLNLGAPFTLTDQHGNKRSTEEFKGKYLLIYFGFAHCPDFVRFYL